MEEKFIQFLKNENIYYRFKGYFAVRHPDKDLTDYLNNTSPTHYIIRAFNWELTDELGNFWSTVNRQWIKGMKEEYDYTITFKSKSINIALLHQDIKKLLQSSKYNIGEVNVKVSYEKIKQ